MIKVTDLSYIYNQEEKDETSALCGVSLDVKGGEFLAVLGANGSGKSTLAKLLAGLLIPTQGRIEVDSLNVEEDNLGKIREKVGFVFQNPDSQIVATIVEEDVAFGPENLGLEPDVIRKRVCHALRLVGLEEFATAEPHFLSEGQKQKVVIAGVLAMEPKILVLDEPTSNLDPAGRREILKIIKRLNRQRQVTVVYITHFLEEAIYADQLVVIDKGKLVLEGKTREILSNASKLRKLGLGNLPISELATSLVRAGLNIPCDVLTPEEMAKALIKLEGYVSSK